MAIFVYQKHPDHNLGGENYPHFRNQTDKLNYTKTFIDLTKNIDFEITRTSFDTAVVNLNIIDTGKKPSEIVGIATGIIPITGDPQLKYWWVVEWNAGANDNVISFNLTLDYWMSYWPLKFNNSLVRVGRKHMNRFYKLEGVTGTFVDFTIANKQLTIPETNTPPAIVNPDQILNWKPKITLINPTTSGNNWKLMVGIVVSSIGGVEQTTNNLYIAKLGFNPPTFYNAWMIFGDYDQPGIYTWLSFPGITQTFYFWINKNDIVPPLKIKYTKPTSLIGNYELLALWSSGSSIKLFVTSLKGAKLSGGAVEQYQQVIKIICELISMGDSLINKRLFRSQKLISVDSNYYINYLYFGVLENSSQLISLKSFFKNNYVKYQNNVWKDQILRNFENVYFTNLNFFNYYMNKTKTNEPFYELNLTLPIKQTTHLKTDLYHAKNELKMYTNCKYYLRFLDKIQEYPLNLYHKRSSVHKLLIKTKQFTTLNNFYCYFKIKNDDMNLSNAKYNFVLKNKTKMLNYTDQSIEFYQQQGISFKTGLDQVKYQMNWLRRYQSFQDTSFKYRQITGAIKGVAGDIVGAVSAVAGAKTGNISGAQSGGLALGLGFDIADRAVNTAFNFQEFNLNQELSRKNQLYSYKSMLARQADIFNQPITTHGVMEDELPFVMLKPEPTSIKTWPDLLPTFKLDLMVLTPTITDWKKQALIYHKSGNVADQLEQVVLNKNTTRRCWNFWEIHNIEQAIIKDNLNSMVVNYFNKKFNDGIRLWNVFFNEVKFNDYSLANWEQYLLQPTNENQ